MKLKTFKGQVGGLNSEDSFEEGELTMDDNSSVSTASPFPGTPNCTDRLTRSWNLDITNVSKSEGRSPTSSTATRSAIKRPGRPHVLLSGAKTSTTIPSLQHSQTMSNTSTCVSPIGSSAPREWGRSFRLFNTSRCLGTTGGLWGRDSAYPTQRTNLTNTIYNKPYLESDRSPRISPHRRLIGSPSCTPASGPYHSNAPTLELLRGSSIFSFYSTAINSPQNTWLEPLLSTFPCTPSRYMSFHTGQVLAKYATGGGRLLQSSLSRFQKELPTLLSTLRTFLALNGETIIVGDGGHRVEIKRGGTIGFGGFAKVYVGVNTVKGELVAIKEIKMEDVDDMKSLKMIEKEFDLLKSLRHPNIVSYHFFEHSRSQKVCRIVMELLAGDSMLFFLQRYGPLKETVLRKLARDLLLGINFIHKNGISHRDIKPANILINQHGKVKLCDFGCSKRVFEISKSASCIIGTPVYMSPEFIKGEADHKADIWSFACSLFELGTGMLPWHHSGVKDNLPLMFYITTTSETPLSCFGHGNMPEFSSDFMNFLELCFTRNPERRPNAEELLTHQWLDNSTVSASADLAALTLSDRLSIAGASPTMHGLDSVTPQSTSPPMLGTRTPRHRTSVLFEQTLNAENSDRDLESKSAVSTQTAGHVEEEILCQHELEEVAAVITTERCIKLMVSFDSPGTFHDRVLTEADGATKENNLNLTKNYTVNAPSFIHPGLARTSTELPSSFFSPDHSILHENFHFNHTQLGSSAGNFYLPNETPEFACQQYLRIDDLGNLEFATVTEFDNELGNENNLILPSSASGDISAFSVSFSSRFLPPLRTSSQNWKSATPTPGDRPNSSPNPKSPARVTTSVSESLFSHVSSLRIHACPLTPSVPLLVRSSGAARKLTPATSPKMQPSNLNTEDLSQPHSPNSVASLQRSALSAFHERVKPHADGKLYMSFNVQTADGADLNVELKVDVSSVHCKIIDHQPNFFVSFTDSIREQIVAKLRQAAQSSAEEVAFDRSSHSSIPNQNPSPN